MFGFIAPLPLHTQLILIHIIPEPKLSEVQTRVGWSQKGHMDTLSHNMAAVFVNTKTHVGIKQFIVYQVHETTLIVLFGLR